MSDLQNRTISVVLKIRDAELASEFWRAHGTGELVFGAKVIGISEGNLIKDVEILENELLDLGMELE